jgi:hypothetical protein
MPETVEKRGMRRERRGCFPAVAVEMPVWSIGGLQLKAIRF